MLSPVSLNNQIPITVQNTPVEQAHKVASTGNLQFCKTVQSISPTHQGASNSCQPDLSKGDGISSKMEKDHVAKAFETMVVSQFLDPLLAEMGKALFGDGVQGDFYKSLFSDAVAESLSQRGGLGLAKHV